MRLGTRPLWVFPLTHPYDLRLGLRWERTKANYWTMHGLVVQDLHIYVCVLPCIGLHLIVGRIERDTESDTKRDTASRQAEAQGWRP